MNAIIVRIEREFPELGGDDIGPPVRREAFTVPAITATALNRDP